MYNVVVAKVFVSPHPDPDVHSLAVGNVLGNTVIVHKDTPNGELGLWFETDGQLSQEFAEKNNLIRKIDPETGKNFGGLFDENRRVRAQKIRGVKSDGFWCPLSYLDGDVSELKEHDKFTSFNETPIAQKYETWRTRAASKAANRGEKALKKPRVELVAMKRHFDTEQFRTDCWKFKKGDLISISEKIHATSQRVANAKVIYPIQKWSLSWFMEKLGFEVIPKSEYRVLIGTRNVILENNQGGATYYGNEKFRYDAIEDFKDKLYKNECLYGEVTYTEATSGNALMFQPTSKTKDKSVIKQYGQKMNYTYGTKQGKSEFWVYRITQTNEDGISVDLTWQQMKSRCEQLGVKMVPDVVEPFIYDGDEGKLRNLVEELTEGASTIDPSHIREGVCVRAERYATPVVLKSKSFLFRVLEGIAKDDAEYQDIEEVS